MQKYGPVILAIGITLVFISFQSCSLRIFRTAPEYDVSDILVEERSNGYLVRIVAHRELRQFEAWINRGNWLYLTIAEAKVKLDNLESLRRAGLVELVEITPFESSVQIAMKFPKKIRYRDIIRDKESNDIIIALHLEWEAVEED